MDTQEVKKTRSSGLSLDAVDKIILVFGLLGGFPIIVIMLDQWSVLHTNFFYNFLLNFWSGVVTYIPLLSRPEILYWVAYHLTLISLATDTHWTLWPADLAWGLLIWVTYAMADPAAYPLTAKIFNLIEPDLSTSVTLFYLSIVLAVGTTVKQLGIFEKSKKR